MKDQVIVTKDGDLAVAIPLFRMQESDDIVQMAGYHVSLHNGRPVAYALDWGQETVRVISAPFLEKTVKFLGDL